MLEPYQPPASARAFDRVHAQLARGGHGLPVKPEVFEAWAQRLTGLDDWGSATHRPGLERLCRSLEEDLQLTGVGRVAVWTQVLPALMTRLRLEALRRVGVPPDGPAPIVVFGLPRSGTTLLHRLLAAVPGVRSLRTWELSRPLPGRGPDTRRLQTWVRLNRLKALAPQMDRKHYFGVDEPEECMFLLDPSFQSFTFTMLWPVRSYTRWLFEVDHVEAYRDWRDLLAALQQSTPGERLVLKAPAHTAHLDALLAARPDALLVQTHREPVSVVGSMGSLYHSAQLASVQRPDPAALGAAVLDQYATSLDRCASVRETLPAGRVVDVAYADLVADPLAVVAAIHRQQGLTWTAAAQVAVADQIALRGQHRFGKHPHSVEELGLSPAQVLDRFAPARERLRALGAPA